MLEGSREGVNKAYSFLKWNTWKVLSQNYSFQIFLSSYRRGSGERVQFVLLREWWQKWMTFNPLKKYNLVGRRVEGVSKRHTHFWNVIKQKFCPQFIAFQIFPSSFRRASGERVQFVFLRKWWQKWMTFHPLWKHNLASKSFIWTVLQQGSKVSQRYMWTCFTWGECEKQLIFIIESCSCIKIGSTIKYTHHMHSCLIRVSHGSHLLLLQA